MHLFTAQQTFQFCLYKKKREMVYAGAANYAWRDVDAPVPITLEDLNQLVITGSVFYDEIAAPETTLLRHLLDAADALHQKVAESINIANPNDYTKPLFRFFQPARETKEETALRLIQFILDQSSKTLNRCRENTASPSL